MPTLICPCHFPFGAAGLGTDGLAANVAAAAFVFTTTEAGGVGVFVVATAETVGTVVFVVVATGVEAGGGEGLAISTVSRFDISASGTESALTQEFEITT